jgi:TolB-like protein
MTKSDLSQKPPTPQGEEKGEPSPTIGSDSNRVVIFADMLGFAALTEANPIDVRAVLPFQQTVGSADTAVLGQGLADSLANALKGISRFTVADVETVSNLKKADQAPEEAKNDEEAARIGKELGVSCSKPLRSI